MQQHFYAFMWRIAFVIIALPIIQILCVASYGQIDDICSDAGVTPGLDSPFAHIPYVYGHITLKGFDPAAKFPNVVAIFSDGGQIGVRYSVGRSGNYCFKRSGNNGSVVVQVNGVEAARRALTSFGASQQREDFEIDASGGQRSTPPAVVSTKYARPPNKKTVQLYKKAIDAEQKNDHDAAITLLNEIVAIDPTDYIAWAKLGSLYFQMNKLDDADKAYRHSLEANVEYTPAWINVGKLRIAQKQFAAAAEIFKHAIELEPSSAATERLLGESYLEAGQGTLAVQALDEAIRLDPIGQAECHLLKAHLYELAGANKLASHEYRLFLTKIPEYREKARLEKFIKQNPE